MSREQDGPLGAPELPGRSGWDMLAIVAVVTGTVLRARHFFAGQSLWLDEAMLALNILDRSCGELFGTLAYQQAAPPFYLCASRAAALPFGGTEMGLRFPSLAAGLLTLVLVWRVGRALVGPEVAAWATWLLAISPLAIYYSNEVKPYMLDAMVAILLVGLARGVLASPREGRRIIWLAGAGLVALLSSFTAPFMLGAVGVVLMFDGATRHDRPGVRRALGLSVLWLVAFLMLYLILYRTAGSSEFLHAYWEDYFLSIGPGWRTDLWTAVMGITGALPIPSGLNRIRVLIPAGVVAVALTARLAGGRATFLMVFPFLAVFLAALLRRYPVADRLVLFLAPAAVLLAAGGLVGAARLMGLESVRWRGAVLGLLVAGAGIAQVVEPPPMPGGSRTAQAAVQFADSAGGHDLVFLTGQAVPTWVYYTTNWRNPDRERLAWFSAQLQFDPVAFHSAGDASLAPPMRIRAAPGTPHARPEAVASPSGLGFRKGGRADSVYTFWGASQVSQLEATQADVIWVYATRLPELLAMATAWEQAGGTIRRHEQVAGPPILELRRRLAEW